MSTSAVSASSLNQQIHQYYQTRQSDLQQLGQDLGAGNLNAAQADFNNIVTLGQSGPFPNGEPFLINQREQDFNAVGQALQNGDLAGAQQAFTTLASTFNTSPRVVDPPIPGGSGSSAGPEVVLNLSGGNSATPEQVTININNASSGGEQVSLSVGNQGSNAQEVTFNLGANTNEQIVLNLLGASSSASGSSTSGTSGTGISVSA
jgi:hypothetical protein